MQRVMNTIRTSYPLSILLGVAIFALTTLVFSLITKDAITTQALMGDAVMGILTGILITAHYRQEAKLKRRKNA